jgi:hypothetical protein
MPEEIPWNSSVFPEKASSQIPGSPRGSFGQAPQHRTSSAYRVHPVRPPLASERSPQATHPLPANQWTVRLYRPVPPAPNGVENTQQRPLRQPAHNPAAFPAAPTRFARPAAPTPIAQPYRAAPPPGQAAGPAASAQPPRPVLNPGTVAMPSARFPAPGRPTQSAQPGSPSVSRTGTAQVPPIWNLPTRPIPPAPARNVAGPARSAAMPASARALANSFNSPGRANQFARPEQNSQAALPAFRSSRLNPPGLRPVQIRSAGPLPFTPQAQPASPVSASAPTSPRGRTAALHPTRPLPAQASRQGTPAPARPTDATARRARPGRSSQSQTLLAALLLLFLGALVIAGTVTVHQQVLANATASNIPYPPYQGTLLLNDPLHDNSAGYHWETMDSSDGRCAFVRGSYHVQTSSDSGLEHCRAQSLTVANFVAQADITLVSGDRGGLVFRASQHSGYLFSIDCHGYYSLVAFSSTGQTRLSGGTSPLITASQSYQLAVVAIGQRIDLYVNQKKITSLQNQQYVSGSIALGAQSIIQPTDVLFSNIKVWQIE